MIKHYTKGDLTVVWKPELCQHTGICAKGLGLVFDPRKSPWVNVDGADAEQIIQQVKKCPSGALSYVLKSDKS